MQKTIFTHVMTEVGYNLFVERIDNRKATPFMTKPDEVEEKQDFDDIAWRVANGSRCAGRYG
jgi:hypothetical protein